MEVDNRFEKHPYSCRRDFADPGRLVMDDGDGSQPHPRSSAARVSTKGKAPSPPRLRKLDSPGFSQWYAGNPHLTMDQKENLMDKDLSLLVVLPDGVEKMTTVHGSKPLMDLLVMLCAKYHLNPSSYTLELVTANRHNIKLKPNAIIGTLDAEKIILKPKGEDKNKRTGPQMPEATVRMVINYRKTQKTILRVNPRVPLAELLPAISEKCEFDMESTVLLRDVQSLAPLDLSCSLNDYAIREIYARDTKAQPSSPVSPPVSPTHAGAVFPGKDKNQKEKENKGLFSKFRKSKKVSDQATTASAPASPVLVSKPRPLSMALPSSNSCPLGSPAATADVPKKRRAPPPPILVSQSCSLDLSPRRRLSSEPNAQLESEQMASLSRGSSAESSLKRTKRKAPPPPKSPSVVAQETVPPDDNAQGGAAASPLGEIMEQEETASSVMSATASDVQGDDSSLGTSADVPTHSPSPDAETQSAMSVDDVGEDQSHDLSSDGNQLHSAVNDSATLTDVGTTANTDSSEPATNGSGPCQVENISQQPACEESATETVEGDCSTVPSGLPPSLPGPVMQGAAAQASVQANTETLREQAATAENPVPPSVSHPTGEDAQVQTDFTPLPAPSQQHMDQVPASANVPGSESAGTKEMATLTGEPDTADLKCALSHTSETSSRQDSRPCDLAASKAPTVYSTDSEPKPKPSNELTRDYIPKVGMTTYTIVPQKSLEKLRYFEVALTLESPPAAPEEGLNVGSLHLKDCPEPREQTEVSKEQSEPHSNIPREELLTSTTTTTQGTVNGHISEAIPSSSPPPASLPKAHDKIPSSANGSSQARSPAEVKEMKIPPATKPKPGSFRLPKPKKTSGYYVTSAAEKSPIASPGSGHMEDQGSAERAKLPSLPPPPPPPVQWQEGATEAANAELSPKKDDKSVAATQVIRQTSLPSKERSLGLSLEKLRNFAAPRPYSPATPSRFAQAVTSAVKRSQASSHSPRSPDSPVPQPSSSATESKGVFKFKDVESRDEAHDKGSTPPAAGGPSVSEVAQADGESCP